jgi:hypothetical protein
MSNKHLDAVNFHFSNLKTHLKTLVSKAEELQKNKTLGSFTTNLALMASGKLDEAKIENFVINSSSHWQSINERDLGHIQENLELFSSVPAEYLGEISMYLHDPEISGHFISEIWDDMIEMCKKSIVYAHHQRCPENGRYTRVWAAGVKLSGGKDLFGIKTWD